MLLLFCFVLIDSLIGLEVVANLMLSLDKLFIIVVYDRVGR